MRFLKFHSLRSSHFLNSHCIIRCKNYASIVFISAVRKPYFYFSSQSLDGEIEIYRDLIINSVPKVIFQDLHGGAGPRKTSLPLLVFLINRDVHIT